MSWTEVEKKLQLCKKRAEKIKELSKKEAAFENIYKVEEILQKLSNFLPPPNKININISHDIKVSWLRKNNNPFLIIKSYC